MTQLKLLVFATRVNLAAFKAEAKEYERLAKRRELIRAAAEKRRRERPC